MHERGQRLGGERAGLRQPRELGIAIRECRPPLGGRARGRDRGRRQLGHRGIERGLDDPRIEHARRHRVEDGRVGGRHRQALAIPADRAAALRVHRTPIGLLARASPPPLTGSHVERALADAAFGEPGQEVGRLLAVRRAAPELPVLVPEIGRAHAREPLVGGRPQRVGDDPE